MKKLGVMVLSAWFISISALASAPAGYYPVWGDEFNGASLDTSKWALRLGGPYRDGYNTLNAVSFNGSNMVISTYTVNGTNYTAMLYAKGKFESKFGYWNRTLNGRTATLYGRRRGCSRAVIH
jgi:hypothetical protein